MSEISPKPIKEPQLITDSLGLISRFNNFDFNGNFSLVVKNISMTLDVKNHPITGNPSVNVKNLRPKDAVIYGRFAEYPANTFSKWYSIAEEESYNDYFGIGTRPYNTISWRDSYIQFIRTNISPFPSKIVLRLLAVKL